MSLVPPKMDEPIPALKETLPAKQATKYKLEQEKQDAIIEIENKPGEYDLEKLTKWRRLGIEKPEWVPHTEWSAIEEQLKPLRGVVRHLAALAMPDAQIAVITGTTELFVKQTVGTLVGKADIQRIQDKIWGDDFKNVIKALIPVAIQTAASAMLDPKTKASVKVDAAFKFMDRAMGKPTQTVEINDNLVRAIYESLDAQAGKVIEMPVAQDIALTNESAASTVKQEPEDAVDRWVNKNL